MATVPAPSAESDDRTLSRTTSATIEIDLSGTVTHWPDAAHRMFAWASTEVEGLPLASVIMSHPQAKRHGDALQRFLAIRRPAALGTSGASVTMCRKDGTRFPAKVIVRVNGAAASVEIKCGQPATAPPPTGGNSAQMRALLDAAPCGICAFDLSGNVQTWNATAERIFGIDADDLLGQPLPILLDAERHEFGGLRNLVLAGETFQDIERQHYRADGSAIHLLMSAAPLRDRSGSVVGGTVTFTDVTERRRVEDEHQQFISLVEHNADFIAILALDGRPIYLNESGRQLVGLDAMTSVLEMSSLDFFAPHGEVRFEEDVLRTARRVGRWDGEVTLRHAGDGHDIDVKGSVFVVRHSETDHPLCLAASFRDITLRKRNEEAIRKRDALLTAVADATHRLIQNTDLADAVAEAIQIVGRAARVDRAFVMRLPEVSDATLLPHDVQWTAAAGAVEPLVWTRPLRGEIRATLAAGRSLSLEDGDFSAEEQAVLAELGIASVLMVPVIVHNDLWGVIGLDSASSSRTFSDAELSILTALASSISGAIARARGERSLIASNQELAASVARQAVLASELERSTRAAQDANVAKSEFLANMSHEIRTPMTAILGYADLLQEADATPDDRATYIRSIRQNGRHLLELINDILDISKIEAGKMQVEQVECSPREIVADVTSMLRVRADEKGLDFKVNYLSPIPAFVRTDPTRLRQILINLLGNAIKFTKAGRVSLDLEVCCPTSPALSNECRLRAIVRDTGIGITSEQMTRLFGAFSQADNSTTRRFGGTGLGLHICKRLARMLGGDLSVTSQYGEGSAFTLEITCDQVGGTAAQEPDVPPAATATVAPPKNNDKPPQIRGRILLAEDGPDNQRLIATYVRKGGAAIEVVDNGRQAVARVQQAAEAGEPFDVVLMDIQMPEMDGLTAIARLREAGSRIPVIALTAHAMPEDRERCLAAGFTDYASKPIDRRRLLEQIDRCMADSAKQRASVAAAPTPSTDGSPACPMPLDGIRSTLADDPDIAELLAGYIADLPAVIAELEAMSDRGDRQEMIATLHRIKGTTANYGFAPLSALAGRAENECRANGDGSASRTLAELVAAIRRVHGFPTRGVADAA